VVIHCAAAERGKFIKKKKKSSRVELKAFQTNVGQPDKDYAI